VAEGAAFRQSMNSSHLRCLKNYEALLAAGPVSRISWRRSGESKGAISALGQVENNKNKGVL